MRRNLNMVLALFLLVVTVAVQILIPFLFIVKRPELFKKSVDHVTSVVTQPLNDSSGSSVNTITGNVVAAQREAEFVRTFLPVKSKPREKEVVEEASSVEKVMQQEALSVDKVDATAAPPAQPAGRGRKSIFDNPNLPSRRSRRKFASLRTEAPKETIVVTPKPPTTAPKAPRRTPKPIEDKVVMSSTLAPAGGTLRGALPASPLVGADHPFIKLLPDGRVDTMKTVIDFTAGKWYDDFQEVLQALENTPAISDAELQSFFQSANGFSQAELTKDHAILSNVCVSSPFGTINFFEPTSYAIRNEAMKAFNMKDFYYSNTRSKHDTVKPASLAAFHTLYLHPRQYTNIFHILEGTSVILRVVLHPELFPRFKHIIIAMQPSVQPDSWTAVFEDLLLATFPKALRPSYLRPVKGNPQTLCDSAMVVAKAWETSGTGSFIGEPLGGDLLRAVAYRLVGFAFERKKKGEKLDVVMIKRLGKRKLLNHDKVVEALEKEFAREISLEVVELEKKQGKEQIALFAKTDVLLAAHGAGMTNLIFMVPNSFVFELFPPEWRFACYQRLAANMRLQYKKAMAVGERGRECYSNPNSISCLYRGTRDRDFTMEPEVVKDGMKEAISKVWSKKYQVK